nr:hypothetical protein [uncultured Cohaesibacter sp.]
MLFRQTHLLRLLSLAFLALALPTAGYSAPPEANRVRVDAVPGLRAYMEKNFMFDPSYHVWAVDLDLPGDQIDEVIIHIEDPGYCGSGGCHWVILRREPDDSLKEIDAVLAGDVTLKRDPHSSVMQVIASTRHGDSNLEIANKTSGQVRLARQKGPAKRSTRQFSGPCRNGFRWTGGAADKGGIARYETCKRDEVLVQFSCQSDTGSIAMTSAISPGSYKVGDTMPALFSVIRKKQTTFFPNPGMLKSSGTKGPLLSVLFDRYDGLLDALKQGDRAMFNASGSRLDLHLKGSSKALAAMLSACPDGRRY